MTQNEKVLEHMRQHGKISQRDAVKFGCYRLSARIHDLKAMGQKIITETKYFKTKEGAGHYAEYRLAE